MSVNVVASTDPASGGGGHRGYQSGRHHRPSRTPKANRAAPGKVNGFARRRCAGGQSGSVGGQVQRVPEGFAQCLRKLLHSQGYIWHPCELNCGRKFARFFLVLHRIHPRILPLTIAARGITGRGRRLAALAALNIASRSDMDGPPQSCLFLLRPRPLLDTGMIVASFFSH